MDTKQPLIYNGQPNNTVIREIIYVKTSPLQVFSESINNYFCIKFIAGIISIIISIILIIIIVGIK